MLAHSFRWTSAAGWSASLGAGDGPQTAVWVFGAAELDTVSDALNELLEAYPTSLVIGCSTAGELQDDLLIDGGLVVAVAQFQSTRLSCAAEQVSSTADSYQVGKSLAEHLRADDPDLRAIFVLSDGTGVNGSHLVAGLTDGAGPAVAISGGLAADGPRFERTWVLAQGQARPGYVAALGFGGDSLRIGHGSRGGWQILGPERRVTKSSGNVLYEVDGQPALELYKRYLGERATGLPATALLFPLSVQSAGGSHGLVRTVLGVDEQTQSMTFAGDVAEGSMARLMRATFDRLIDAAHAAAAESAIPTRTADGDTLALAVSCVGRRLVLGRRTEDELAAAMAGLPTGAMMVGYYSYGEITPWDGGACDLLNQTMTVTTFAEAA